jgi:adenine-specific DNA-methyltransferase
MSVVNESALAPVQRAETYKHQETAVQRPEVSVQPEFEARKSTRTCRYDSSLDPALAWDENRERDLAEWLLGLIEHAGEEGEDTVFATEQVWKGGGVRVSSVKGCINRLKDLTKPYLNWAGKAERGQIAILTLPLFIHERHSTKAILETIRHRKPCGQTLDLFGDPRLDTSDQLAAYEHIGPWVNRMILGDNLQVMNSLLEYEALGGQVQMSR